MRRQQNFSIHKENVTPLTSAKLQAPLMNQKLHKNLQPVPVEKLMDKIDMQFLIDLSF